MKYSGRHVGVIAYGCFDRTGQFEGSRRLFAVGYSSGDGHARIGVERPFHRHQLYGNFRSSGPLARMNVEASSTANDWPGAHLPPQTPYRALSTKSDTSPVYHSSHLPNIHLPLITRMGGIVFSGTTPASHPSLRQLGYGYISHHQGAGARLVAQGWNSN